MDLHFSCFLCTLDVGELEATGIRMTTAAAQ